MYNAKFEGNVAMPVNKALLFNIVILLSGISLKPIN